MISAPIIFSAQALPILPSQNITEDEQVYIVLHSAFDGLNKIIIKHIKEAKVKDEYECEISINNPGEELAEPTLALIQRYWELNGYYIKIKINQEHIIIYMSWPYSHNI